MCGWFHDSLLRFIYGETIRSTKGRDMTSPKDLDAPAQDEVPPTARPPSTGPQAVAQAHPAPTCSALRQAGDRIGPYRLLEPLGAGAFGEVWLALKEGALGQTRLAVKLPHPGRVDLEAIKQEVAIWVEASHHPNVMPVFEAHVYDGQVVIASEVATDGSLAAWLERRGGKAPSIEVACEMLCGILSGLQHLHSRGIVHRDLKPANVLLQKGVPRLADFGISRSLSSGQATFLPAGTPAFMAPEAFDGVRSVQTDLWSAGVVFHLLVAGSLPFPQREWTAVMKAILTSEPAPLPAAVPPAVGAIIKRSLQKEPGQRWGSAEEMAARIVEVNRSLSASADKPILVFEYSHATGWLLRNVGSGAALDVIVAGRWLPEPWKDPVRVPPLAAGQSLRLAWLDRSNIDVLGASYRDARETPFSAVCQHDLTKHHEGNVLGEWEEYQIKRHWQL
jgi:serine/threonine protein kinase